MENKNYKMRVPDIVEVIFDIGYLSFAFIAGIIFLVCSKGQNLFILYGCMTLILFGGDSFHLVPRVEKALKGPSEAVTRKMNFGLLVSSITMTIFYVTLLDVWENTFPELKAPGFLVALIWLSAVVRIVICLLPQNYWMTGEGSFAMSALRNGIFAITGIGVIALYVISGNTYDYHMGRMVAAIIISFACYMPVVLFAKKKPVLGILMMPKTCAYIWMIVMGLQLLF